MIKKTTLILILLLTSSLARAWTSEDLAGVMRDGYLINPITNTPIKTKVATLTKKTVDKIKLTKLDSYFNEVFELSQQAIYAPTGGVFKKDKPLNGVVLFMFKGWVGEDLKAWIRVAMPFKNDIPDEKVFFYHPSGNVEIEMKFLNGQIDGVMKFQDDDGNRTKESVYDNGTILSSIKYYKSGAINERLVFNNGSLSSVKLYNKDGSIKYENNYELEE